MTKDGARSAVRRQREPTARPAPAASDSSRRVPAKLIHLTLYPEDIPFLRRFRALYPTATDSWIFRQILKTASTNQTVVIFHLPTVIADRAEADAIARGYPTLSDMLQHSMIYTYRKDDDHAGIHRIANHGSLQAPRS